MGAGGTACAVVLDLEGRIGREIRARHGWAPASSIWVGLTASKGAAIPFTRTRVFASVVGSGNEVA